MFLRCLAHLFLSFSLLSGFFLKNSLAADSFSMSIVELSGKEIPSFLGKDISKIRVVIFKKGKWQAIPYQIDEKAYDPIVKSRRWVLGSAFSRRTKLPRGNGRLDEDEVILFTEKDMGEKIPLTHLLSAAQILEVKIKNSYAYLLFESKNLLKNNQSYIQYDVSRDLIDAVGYQMQFHPRYPVIQESLLIKNRVGSPLNILDRFKVRALLAIKNFFDFKIQEEGITSRKIGYRLGPIRLIRRTVAYKSLGPFRVSPKVESDFLFYPYYVRIPSHLHNPFDGPTHLSDRTHGFAGFDFNKNFQGSKFYTERNSKPVLMDGSMSEPEKNLTLNDVSWWAIEGKNGSMIVKVEWDPALTQRGVTCNLYYKDDQKSLAPPESDPGELTVGFQLDYSKIPAGKFNLYLSQIFPPESFSKERVKNLIQQAIKSPSILLTPQ